MCSMTAKASRATTRVARARRFDSFASSDGTRKTLPKGPPHRVGEARARSYFLTSGR